LALVLVCAACGAGTGSGGTQGVAQPTATATSAAAATPAVHTPAVSITGDTGYGSNNTFTFDPASITVKVGTAVTWTNQSGVPHTVTSDAGAPTAFTSGTLGGSDTYSFTFTKAGTYHYHCNVHNYMHGTIVVTP